MNMEDLHGARVAILESRMSDQLASLVRARGGVPDSVPALRESPLECGDQVNQLIDLITSKSMHVIFFLTGVGVKSLVSEASKLGREAELIEGLKEITIVCRGPKPSAAVREIGINNFVAVKEPFTTADVLRLIDEMDLNSKSVALVHYGERSLALAQELKSRSCVVYELCLYEWLLPEDTAPLSNLIKKIVAGAIDIIIFTTQIQVRHLIKIATQDKVVSQLLNALNTKVIVTAIGPTTATALNKYGVKPDVIPEHPKIGPMLNELVNFFRQRENTNDFKSSFKPA